MRHPSRFIPHSPYTPCPCSQAGVNLATPLVKADLLSGEEQSFATWVSSVADVLLEGRHLEQEACDSIKAQCVLGGDDAHKHFKQAYTLVRRPASHKAHAHARLTRGACPHVFSGINKGHSNCIAAALPQRTRPLHVPEQTVGVCWAQPTRNLPRTIRFLHVPMPTI